jgi:hypothetical protein
MMGSVEEKIRAGGLIRVRCQPAGDCFESLEEDVSNGVKFAYFIFEFCL